MIKIQITPKSKHDIIEEKFQKTEDTDQLIINILTNKKYNCNNLSKEKPTDEITKFFCKCDSNFKNKINTNIPQLFSVNEKCEFNYNIFEIVMHINYYNLNQIKIIKFSSKQLTPIVNKLPMLPYKTILLCNNKSKVELNTYFVKNDKDIILQTMKSLFINNYELRNKKKLQSIFVNNYKTLYNWSPEHFDKAEISAVLYLGNRQQDYDLVMNIGIEGYDVYVNVLLEKYEMVIFPSCINHLILQRFTRSIQRYSLIMFFK